MGNYYHISGVVRSLIQLIVRVWLYSVICAALCTVTYVFYGGYITTFCVLFTILGLLYHAQSNFLFYPELPSHSRVCIPKPSDYGLPYEIVQTRTRDGTVIHMYFIGQSDVSSSPTFVFFHGNAGNIGHRLQNCAGLFYTLKCNVLMVEYRGYGHSAGYPTEGGLYLDAMAALDYLFTRDDINHKEIVVFGRSLGGAVAIHLATSQHYHQRIMCVIVENTFTSIPEMAYSLLGCRLLRHLPLVCYKNKFLSIEKVRKLKVPCLFISGLDDVLVPPKMMKDLYRYCSSAKKQLLQLSGGTHNDTWTVKNYYQSMAVFLKHCRELKTVKLQDICKIPTTNIQLANGIQTV